MLELAPNDEITTLGQAVNQRIQWKRVDLAVQFAPKGRSPTQMAQILPS
jgi:hypothetical protein